MSTTGVVRLVVAALVLLAMSERVRGQEPCFVVGVSPTFVALPNTGGTVEIAIEMSGPSCEWEAWSFSGGYPPYTSCGNSVAPCFGVGSGTLFLEVDPNPYGDFTAWIEVEVCGDGNCVEVIVTVAPASCASNQPALSSSSSTLTWQGGGVELIYLNSVLGCEPVAVSSQPWVVAKAGPYWDKGTSGPVWIEVAPYAGTGARMATVSVDGTVHTITQSGSADCNANGLGDAWEIAQGLAIDTNGNGVPDTCETGWTDFCGWATAIGDPGMSLPGGNVYVSNALVAFDDGDGVALYAGGNFTSAGGVAALSIARWDGAHWSAVGGGMDGPVFALTVFNDGSGPALYAAGQFSSAGGVPVANIARWDGSSWTPLGAGVGGKVDVLLVFDDGTGPALFAGGGFATAGGEPANGIARWDGESWSPLGQGVDGWVYGLAGVVDASGASLFVTGSFTTAGGGAANRIARWDGELWTSLGSGMNATVWRAIVFDDGDGPALYAGGNFTTAGGMPANRVAKWDGASWSPLGSGMNNWVRTFEIFNDGRGGGPALYAGGWFTQAGGVSANRVARWDGGAWSGLGSGVNNTVEGLAVASVGAGPPTLFVGGGFSSAGGASAGRIAAWQCESCAVTSVSPTFVALPNTGGIVEIAIEMSGPDCEWEAWSFSGGYPPYTSCGNSVAPCFGVGSGTLFLEVDPNPYGDFTAWIEVTICDGSFGVGASGCRAVIVTVAPGCAESEISVEPAASQIGWEGGSIGVAWSQHAFCLSPPGASSDSPWIEVVYVDCDDWKTCNSGTAWIEVAPFSGVGTRVGTVEIGGALHTITQTSSPDCNGNGLGDAWEIDQGLALDLDGNGIPDECEGYRLQVPSGFPSVQAALDAIPIDTAAVYTIEIGVGTFGGFDTGGRSVIIAGCGVGQTVIVGGGAAYDGMAFYGWFDCWERGGASIEVRDLTFSGTGLAIGGYCEVRVERVEFLEAGLGVGVPWEGHVRIVESSAADAAIGFSLAGGNLDDVQLIDSTAVECGIGFAITGLELPQLLRCRAEACDTGVLSSENGFWDGGGGIRLIDCALVGNASAGWIAGYGDWGFASGGEVSGTTGGWGIDAADGEPIHLIAVTIANNAAGGVRNRVNPYYGDGVIADCTFEHNGGWAVDLSGYDYGLMSIADSAFIQNEGGIRTAPDELWLDIANSVFVGGGTAITGGSWWATVVSVSNCEIRGQAVAFDFDEGSPILTNNLIAGNAAVGTIAVEVSMTGNTFADNGSGLAIESLGWTAGIVDNLFCGNPEPQLTVTFSGDPFEIGPNTFHECCTPSGACDQTVPAEAAALQAAIAKAPDGTAIFVEPGTIHGAIDFLGRAITIESIGGPEVSVIDASGTSGPAVKMSGGAAGVADPVVPVLRGFTVTGGSGGAAIPDLDGVFGGGGILLLDTIGRIEQCVVVGNEAPSGGGIYAYRGAPVVRETRIAGNAAGGNGGGVLLFESAATIEASTIEGNTAGGQGGGVYAYLGAPLLAESELVGNEANGSGGGVAWFAGATPMSLDVVLVESNLAGISGPAAWVRSGFTNLLLSDVAVCGSGTSPIAGGFTPVGVVVIDSVCPDCNGNGIPDSWEILTGAATDTAGDGRPDECHCFGDFNLDGVVDGGDLGMLLLQWNTANPTYDLNNDGIVNGGDLGLLLLQWGPCP